jgi:hypothetical protein
MKYKSKKTIENRISGNVKTGFLKSTETNTGYYYAKGRDILLIAGFTSVASMTGRVAQWQMDCLPLATGQ